MTRWGVIRHGLLGMLAYRGGAHMRHKVESTNTEHVHANAQASATCLQLGLAS